MKLTREDRYYIAAIVIGPILVVACLWFAAVQESKAYNRLTGANTTWWDAVWLELRVEDKPK